MTGNIPAKRRLTRVGLFALCIGWFFVVAAIVYASVTVGSIDSTNTNARLLSDSSIVNFGATNSNVVVTDSTLTGYAWGENTGWINLAPTNGGVVNDGEGNLSGYAWGEGAGWVNFNPTNGGVTIGTTGFFTG